MHLQAEQYQRGEGITLGRRFSKPQRADGLANTRIPVKVQEGEGGVPQSVLLDGRWKRITSVVEDWDVSETLSGEKRLIKSYFRVSTDSVSCLTLFRNQVTGSWYREEPTPKTYNARKSVNNS